MKHEIIQDEIPMNPRTEFDNLGTMVCGHKRYTVGDKDHGYNLDNYSGWKELRKAIVKDHGPCVILPVYLLDHSGLRVNTIGFNHCDPQRWDWGQLGIIYVSHKKIRAKRVTKKLIERVTANLRSEVKTYNQYLSGDVWGVRILDDDGNEVDSCWGFLGYEYAKQEAERMLNEQN